jgi:hypothetical protein
MAKVKANVENPIEAAQKVLADLVAKRDATAQARAADESTMAELAFEAHTGDQRAEAKLETLKERALRKDLELRSIDSAIQIAKEKVALAQAEAARAAERAVAAELKELAKHMRASAKKCDAALAMLTEGAKEIRDAIARTNARGLGNPSATQLQSLGERAVLTALLEMPWARAFQHIAPRDRQTFVGFATQWAFAIERAVDAKLKLGGGEQAA